MRADELRAYERVCTGINEQIIRAKDAKKARKEHQEQKEDFSDLTNFIKGEMEER